MLIHALNRLIVFVVAVVLAVASLLYAVVAAGWVDPPTVAVLLNAPGLEPTLQLLPGVGSIWAPTAAVAAFALSFGVAVLELRPASEGTGLTIARDRQGTLSVSLGGLGRLADYVISGLPGVEGVVSRARLSGRGVVLVCRLVVKPEANTPTLAQDIRERLGAAMRDHVGSTPYRIDIHTQVGQPALKGKRVR